MKMDSTKLLKRSEVVERIGFSYQSIWNWMKKGDFPLPIQTDSKHVRWFESEINDWIASRPRKTYSDSKETK